MNEYESIYVLRGDVVADNVKKFQEKIESIVSKKKGVIFAQKDRGGRALAYPIQRETRGQYMQLNFAGSGELVEELERNFRIADEIIRHITVLVVKDVDVKKKQKEYKQGEATSNLTNTPSSPESPPKKTI